MIKINFIAQKYLLDKQKKTNIFIKLIILPYNLYMIIQYINKLY